MYMQRLRSSVHETTTRADGIQVKRSAASGRPPKHKEIRLKVLVDTIPGSAWSAFSDGQVECCNLCWLDYTGMSLRKIKGWGWTNAIHPQDKNALLEGWRAAVMGSTSFAAEARMRRCDGTYRRHLIQANPLRSVGGEVIRWVGTYTDTEDHGRAEDAQEQARSGEFFEQDPEAIAVLSTDDRIVRVNREFTRMFGYEPDELRGKPIHDLIVPDGYLEGAQECSDQLSLGGRVEKDTIRQRKDGTQFHVSLLAFPLTEASGEPFANCAVYRDITERKRSEERMRETEALFQTMADTAPVLIWMTGTDGLCNYFNKPWLEFTGRTMEQEVGMGWTEGVHPDDLQGCFDGFLPAFHARLAFGMEYRLRRADGEFRWVIESGIPRYTPGGEFVGYIGSNIDITERKRAEAERERLRQVQAELAHINRVTTMGELTASLAHEIKQPIAAAVTDAQTCLRWLVRERPDIEEAREALSRIIKDVIRASEVTSRIRSLFKKGEPQRELVDVNEIIREMIALLGGEAERYSIAIHTELAKDLPSVRADRVQLQQVFLNLMLNAFDAMKELNVTRELTIKSQRNREDQLQVSVIDNGVGLPPEHADTVFNAFFTTKSEGTGMGLSISRSIIQTHGGSLWASRNSENGATFQFTLPRDVKVI
jgi:PAS domain S-box-containing protein